MRLRCQGGALGIVATAFAEGANWADEHPIVKVGGAAKNYQRGYEFAELKATQWLGQNIDNYLFIDNQGAAGIKWNDFINDLKKHMEQ